jgi:2-polyprenyl-3-methyl-5-hydroxy-6-metoxy-1,4-benzoquinol methylase
MKNIIYSTRTKSVVTGLDNIEHLITMKKFPVFIGNTKEPVEEDLFFDMIWDICKDTGIIQLRNTLKPDLIYSKYHSESIGDVWENHRVLFAEVISRYIEKKGVLEPDILEIGGSNGKLASIVLNSNHKIKNWTIVEPNILKPEEQDKKITYIDSFFENTVISKKDIIVHSHTLEHVYDINNFLYLLHNSLIDNGLHVFSIPNLYEFLKSKFINTINFEHTVFLTEEITDYLLSKHKFRIIDKIYYKNHSILYVTRKTNDTVNCAVPSKYEEYKEMYLSCIKYYKNFVSCINKKLESFGGEVYLFGGHVFSQFLLNFGLNSSRIKLILDNSVMKNNTRLYGYGLEIRLPSQVDIKPGSAVILKVGSYREEILEILKKQNNDIIIWE